GACVTVNIHFPAAAATKAADAILDDIQGKEDAPGRPSAPLPPKKSAPPTPPRSDLGDRWKRVAFGLAVAEAAEPDLNISTPAIHALRDSMRTRYAELRPHLDSGVLGITNTGFLGIRDAAGLSLGERARLNGLIEQQSKDLRALYEEIAKANALGAEAVPQLQKTFADRWRERAKPGRWIQTDKGAWVKK
ncbi:MAG: DUF1318 domain-containing protein, partial [candidate division NC10 bacterium]